MPVASDPVPEAKIVDEFDWIFESSKPHHWFLWGSRPAELLFTALAVILSPETRTIEYDLFKATYKRLRSAGRIHHHDPPNVTDMRAPEWHAVLADVAKVAVIALFERHGQVPPDVDDLVVVNQAAGAPLFAGGTYLGIVGSTEFPSARAAVFFRVEDVATWGVQIKMYSAS